MSGFSPDWLALREPVDHRSRNVTLAKRLSSLYADRQHLAVVDLGCGTGSNIRATYKLLPATQTWTLVDYDMRLLAVARERLTTWADACAADGEKLDLVKDGKRLNVDFLQADLTKNLDGALGAAPGLVTASAVFDLCSEAFIVAFAKAVVARKASFYTVLTYDGVQTWTPAHSADAAMTAAFHAHQKTDKGFGRAAGPDAPDALAQAFRAAGVEVAEGASPWRMGPADQALIDDLAAGFSGAVAEQGTVPATVIAAWRAQPRTGAIVGHRDTLALAGQS